jgi:arylsulfatase A-like enzyme
VFRAAMRWLKDNAANTPFFLWIDSFDPHEPWDPPTSYADRYYAYEDAEANQAIDFIYPNNQDASPAEQKRMKALYCGEVTLVDKWVGAFLNQVDALKLWDDTVVMVTSDHGTQLMDRNRFGKGAAEMYPFNTRIPWYIRHPDGPGKKSIRPFVQSHDLLPTALGLLDIPYANVDGQNAWPLVTGERQMLRDHIVSGWASFVTGNAGGRACVRDDEWSYMTMVHEEDPTPELYHLTEDPDELDNVHDQYPDIVARQRARVEAVVGQPLPAQLNEVCDPGPPPLHFYLQHKAT